ncbi:MAG: hypothetical protein LBJ59_11680 [Zoogloeaceae bacterium]|jgi:plasmid stability protein|nr:hypothetical protein [Zoogloeaceae bacterium]
MKVKTRLRAQAALHGRSMEDEARDILRAARLATRNVRNFADCGVQVIDPWNA